MKIVRSRAEAFGAWLQLDDGSLVAVDRVRARRLGVPRRDSTGPARPLEVHVAVTRQCPVDCSGCYQSATPDGEHVPYEEIRRRLAQLADFGVFTVAFGGGEPLAHPRIGDLGREARRLGLVPVVTTSGFGCALDVVATLQSFAQVNVSHDGVAGSYASVRGFDGARAAERAIAMLIEAGIPVGVNFVLTRASFEHVESTARHVSRLGVRELQLLRYKPAGRAAGIDYDARRLVPSQIAAFVPLLERLTRAHAPRLSVRVDCALVPFFVEHMHDARALEPWGIFGCEAGRHLAALGADGSLKPCSFVDAASEARGGTTNALDHEWERSAALEPFRGFVGSPDVPCKTCALRTVCRGGCKIVSAHVEGVIGADPECPRVCAHRRASGARVESACEAGSGR